MTNDTPPCTEWAAAGTTPVAGAPDTAADAVRIGAAPAGLVGGR